MGIPIISLFCGCGGLDLGFTRAGFEVVLAVDVDPVAVETYNFNHGKLKIREECKPIALVRDLAQFDGDNIIHLLRERCPETTPRGVIGGPPCQPFSKGNVHTKDDDAQRTLPGRYATILERLNDEYALDFFIFENVKGITYKRHEDEFAHFRASFQAAGFKLCEGLLDAADFGIPQIRPRVFVIGLNAKKCAEQRFDFPETNRSPQHTVGEAIDGLPEPAFFERGLTANDIPHHPNHWTMQPRSRKFQDGSLEEGQSKGRSFRVLSRDKPSWTVAYGNREIHIHPSCKRRLSIYEAMLLQDFPGDYRLLGTFSDQVRQVCDAVPPLVAEVLARAIRLFLFPKDFHQDLLSWFEEAQRSFPWRSQSAPYRVLVAEKLLQQTAARELTVQTYERFLELYPSLEHLAVATVPDLEEIIQPLGLSYRARDLQSMAEEILSRHNGKVPDDLDELLALTGVGDYTARAVLCFAFVQDVPIVDTNVARFLYRLCGKSGSLPSNPARNKELIELAGALLPEGRAREFNWAILDLCAQFCRPSRPVCSACPVRAHCVYSTKRDKAPDSPKDTPHKHLQNPNTN